jgi:quercetin dioxygenase-like cupin family protein
MPFFTWNALPEIAASNVQFQVKRKLVHLENVMVVSLEMEVGVEVPLHQHPHEQIGVVLQGSVEVVIGDKKRVIGPGEGYLVPSNMKHGGHVIGEESCVLLDVFSPIRVDFLT